MLDINTQTIEPITITTKSILHIASSLFTKSSDAVLVISANLSELKITFVNNAFTKMSGYQEKDILNKSAYLFQGQKTKTELKDIFTTCLEEGIATKEIMINYKKDGTEYHVEWKLTPIADQCGETIAFLVMLRDLTFIRSFLNKLIKAQDRSKDFYTNLFYSAVHDNKEIISPASKTIEKKVNITESNDDLFFDCDEDSATTKIVTNKISALEYHQNHEIEYSDITQLQDILEECITNIEFALIGKDKAHSMNAVINDMQDFSNIVFLIDEFAQISETLSQLVNALRHSNKLLLEDFLIETIHLFLIDVQTWVNAVFIHRDTNDIHELDNSICASAQQLLFILK